MMGRMVIVATAGPAIISKNNLSFLILKNDQINTPGINEKIICQTTLIFPLAIQSIENIYEIMSIN